MIRRLLVLVGLAVLGWWWWRRSIGPDARSQAEQASGEPGPMVRDRECNTFLPRARALVLSDGDQEYFFCSEACRRAHQARLDSSRSA